MSDAPPPDDEVNLAALARLWPLEVEYGTPGSWWQYVGRSIRERDGYAPVPVDTRPRGSIRTRGRRRRRADSCAGEI